VKFSFPHLETLEFDSAILVLLKMGEVMLSTSWGYPKPKEFGICAKLSCMRIGRFDGSMIPVPVVKRKERRRNRNRKDHGSQVVGGTPNAMVALRRCSKAYYSEYCSAGLLILKAPNTYTYWCGVHISRISDQIYAIAKN